MGGVSIAPIAETSAMVEPEIPEKKYSASATDMPRPPRTRPMSARASGEVTDSKPALMSASSSPTIW